MTRSLHARGDVTQAIQVAVRVVRRRPVRADAWGTINTFKQGVNLTNNVLTEDVRGHEHKMLKPRIVRDVN